MNESRPRRQLRGELYKEGSSAKHDKEVAGTNGLARVVMGRRRHYNA